MIAEEMKVKLSELSVFWHPWHLQPGPQLVLLLLHLKRAVVHLVLHPQPFCMRVTLIRTWARLFSLSQSISKVLGPSCFQQFPFKGKYVMLLEQACRHMANTQHVLTQCLSKALSEGIISSSNFILLHILSLITWSHLLCCVLWSPSLIELPINRKKGSFPRKLLQLVCLQFSHC